MNRKIWLVIFLLGSLILLLGGMRKPERPRSDSDDPVTKHAQIVAAHAVDGTREEWRQIARGNPQWILQLEAVEE